MPTLTFAAGSDAFIPNAESVSWFDRFGNAKTMPGAAIRFGPALSERMLSSGEYQQQEISWMVDAGQGNPPIPGWYLTDSHGLAYTVLSADQNDLSGRPYLVRTRWVNVPGLLNSIDWYRITQTTNAYGDRIASLANFTLMASAVPARIQPATPEVLDILGKRGLLNHYSIWVLPDWNLTYGDIITDNDNSNTQYKVVGWKNKEELAEALLILATKQP